MSQKLRAVPITLAELVQELEDAALAVYLAFRLEDAEGPRLDWLGAKVGQAREGLSDTDYRRTIQARIAVHRSNGTRERIIQIANAFTDIREIQSGGGVAFIGVGHVALALVTTLFKFLRDALEVTVRLQVKYLVQPDTLTFAMAYGTTTTFASSSNSLTVASTEGLPDFGTVMIGMGTAAQQVATYTSKTATQLNGFTTVLNAQPVGTIVTLNDTAKGYTNGYYAGLLEG